MSSIRATWAVLPSWLSIVLLGLSLRCISAQSGDWCLTGVQLLPNLTALLSSSAYDYYGAADDECSSLYFTAIDSSPAAASPSVLLRTDETLTVSLVNQLPIPASLLASGFRYVTAMEYSNLRLFAAVTTTLPLSASAAAAPSRRHRSRSSAATSASMNVSSGLAVLSTVNLTVLAWYPLTESVALQAVAIDYGDSTLYASAAVSVSSLFHFAIAADGRLSRLPDIQLASPPLAAIRGSALLYPAGLLFYVAPLSQPSAAGHEANFTGAVLQYDVKTEQWSTLLNATTALPVTGMADLWSTSQPAFGSLHVLDARSLYDYDSC